MKLDSSVEGNPVRARSEMKDEPHPDPYTGREAYHQVDLRLYGCETVIH